MPGLVPGIHPGHVRPRVGGRMDGRNESGYDVVGGTARDRTNVWSGALEPLLEIEAHGVVGGLDPA